MMENSQQIEAPVKAVKSTNRTALLSMMSRGRKKKNSAADRRHKRHACSCLGKMSILNRSLSLEGIITEVAKGGVKFRPAKTYLLDRTGVEVSIEIAGHKFTGKIAASRADGYGIAFFDELSDDDISYFLVNEIKN